ncbi:MAG: hypothetical protein RJB66_1815 [Pseudomonadota bacterium]|jgi:hypothetical protein
MKHFSHLLLMTVFFLISSKLLAVSKSEKTIVALCESYEDTRGIKPIKLEVFSRPNPYKDLDCEFDVYADIKTIEDGVAVFQQRFLVYNYTKHQKQIEHFYGDRISIQIRLPAQKQKASFYYGSILASMDRGPKINRNLKCYWKAAAPPQRPIRESNGSISDNDYYQDFYSSDYYYQD